jgi:hypothetical protein
MAQWSLVAAPLLCTRLRQGFGGASGERIPRSHPSPIEPPNRPRLVNRKSQIENGFRGRRRVRRFLSFQDPPIKKPRILGLGAPEGTYIRIYIGLKLRRLLMIHRPRAAEIRCRYLPVEQEITEESAPAIPNPIRGARLVRRLIWSYVHESTRSAGEANSGCCIAAKKRESQKPEPTRTVGSVENPPPGFLLRIRGSISRDAFVKRCLQLMG